MAIRGQLHRTRSLIEVWRGSSDNKFQFFLVAHPNEREAFYAFVDRFTADAPPETFAMPQSQTEIEAIDKLIQQKVQQQKPSS